MKLLCWLKTIWRTGTSPQFWLGGYPILGHSYVEQENGDLLCKTCGDLSIIEYIISKEEKDYYDKL